MKNKRLDYLIEYLISEDSGYLDIEIPDNIEEKKKLLRSLMNVRLPKPISKEFLTIQDEYLQEELRAKDITSINDLIPIREQLYLWKGDITKLDVDVIVNAANSALLGCFVPLHDCIDNVIHSNAGIQLRLECQKIMEKQKSPEKPGLAKITNAYNLPSKYVIHTVGPIINGPLSEDDRMLLSSCYRSCLELADDKKLNSIAFCCISTGVYNFPNEIAARIAVDTVVNYLQETNSKIEVVFNVFKEKDYQIYRELLG